MPSKADWTGITRHGNGWRAQVSNGRHRPKTRKQFPRNTPPQVMQAWRADTKALIKVARKQRASRGTFEGDARRYLAAIAALPTLEQRRHEIGLWVAEFGTRQRDEIRSSDIRKVRDTWLKSPRSKTDKRPVSPATVNKRLRALRNLYTVLDGRHAPNPVAEVPEAQEPAPRARALTAETIQALIGTMPRSVTRLRVIVLAETGWPSGLLMALKVKDIDWKAGIAALPARRKGHGASGVRVPLSDKALVALRLLRRLKALGAFSRHSLNKSLKRAGKKLTPPLPHVRPYDLRHSYATALAQASGDERAVAALLQHADLRTTRRYTLASVDPRIQKALAALGRQFGPT